MILRQCSFLFNKHQLLIVQKHLDAVSKVKPFVLMTYRPSVLTPDNLHVLFTASFDDSDVDKTRLIYALANDAWEEYKYIRKVYELPPQYRFKFSTHDLTSYKLRVVKPDVGIEGLSPEEQMLIAMLA